MYNINLLSWFAGILLSLSCGPLGPFIIWRNMSSFGNTLSHASLLGLAFALLLHLNSFFVVLFLLVILSIIIVYIEYFSNLALDTILGVITYSSLSIGMILLSMISKNEQVNLNKYLFGDLLVLNIIDFWTILVMTVVIICTIYYFWNSMMSTIISTELAQVHGIHIFKMRLMLTIMTALLIGISTKLIGSLLITALLILPPAIVQKFVSSPEEVVCWSIILNIVSMTLGIIFSCIYVIPVSPVIILIESIIFVLSFII